ncbi:MAG: glycosyltransferase family 9 protein [Oceanicaulis sp.]
MTRILYITATRIGDAILFSGPLAHLMERFPDARITVACGPLAAPLFEAAPGVERVIVMAKKKRGGHWFDLWREALTTRWTLVVDMRGSITSWGLAAKSRKVNRRKPGHEHDHRVREAAAVLGLDPPPSPRLWIPDAAFAAADRALPSNQPVLAVSPTASAPYKEWAPERFSALIDTLAGPGGAMAGAVAALFGGPGDEATSKAVADGVEHAQIIDLTGALALTETAAALSRARLFIGNDSGLMHMAAAAGTPTLGLFGPTDQRIYGPWGRHARAVHAGETADERARGTLRHSQESLMGGLEVETVIAAAEALYAETV